MLVYLAGPITHIGREAAVKREDALEEALAKEGIVTFAPANAWSVPGLIHHAGIQLVDDVAIAVSDAVVATYLPTVPSEGTDHEIRVARSLGKPVVAYAPFFDTGSDQRAWLEKRGLDPLTRIFLSVDEVVAILSVWKGHWDVGH